MRKYDSPRWLTLAGTVILTVSAFLTWVKAPITGGANPSISFGWAAALLGAMAGLAWFYRASNVSAVCAVIGLGLCGFSIVHLALRDPAFWSLVDENSQYASIMSFSRRNLPANYGIEPVFELSLATETVLGRLATACYFMGWGWLVCLIGGLLILIPSLNIIRERRHLGWVVLTAGMMLVAQGTVLFKGFAAQALQEKADRDITLGHYAVAIERYQTAQQWDPQLTGNEQTHLHLGDAYDKLGMLSHPYAHFYLGDRYAQGGNFEAAIPEYLMAAQEASAPLQAIIHKRIAWTYVTLGLGWYLKGEVSPAVGWWEGAVAFDPAQLQAIYFLSRAYFDQGRYEQSIALGRFLMVRSQNRLLNANVQANLGDAYWKLNDFTSARAAYEASISLDSFANFRIFKSLGGT
jgi:tetratricopeptide repeat protein